MTQDTPKICATSPTLAGTKIDAVVTFVSPSRFLDDIIKRGCEHASAHDYQVDASPQRYQNTKTIYYSLYSLVKFAPWLSHIYVLVNIADYEKHFETLHNMFTSFEIFNGTAPDKFKLVYHSLKTANSNVIEANVYQEIPTLADNFLLVNDDMFLGREVAKDDFFFENHMEYPYLENKNFYPKYYFQPKFLPKEKPKRLKNIFEVTAYNANKILKVPGCYPIHQIKPYNKLILAEFDLDEMFRFDSKPFGFCNYVRNEFDIPLQIFAPNEYYEPDCSTPPISEVYVKTTNNLKVNGNSYEYVRHVKPKLFCLNDTQLLKPEIIQHQQNFLSNYFEPFTPP